MRLIFQGTSYTLFTEDDGSDMAKQLIEVGEASPRGGAMRIRGYIGEPGLTRSTRAHLISFLNQRPVESPVVVHGVREGYRGALGRGQHAVTFLFLELDPQMVDVNVHPAKREVRFRDGNAVQAMLTEAVEKAIDSWRDRRFGAAQDFTGAVQALLCRAMG